MKKQQQALILTILSLAVLVPSCSDLKKDLPTETAGGAQIHGQGWIDTASINFHGLAIQSAGWSTSSCKECHGPDYKGGRSGSSCLTCHSKPGGPENCTLCHGSTNAAPPKDLAGNTASSFASVGTHQSHMLVPDSLGAVVACNECHKVPTSLTTPGHIDTTAGAEVQFTGATSTSSIIGNGVASYSHTTLKCTNTYCHGNFRNGNNVSPMWTDTSGQYDACGSCHGDTKKTGIGNKALPKTAANGGTHPNNTNCFQCHPNVIDGNYKFKGTLHINGRLD
jgi:predicted CxxxxCH...CXXCH cytochrome family protein